tara:strand:- start:869 stop:1378 length:510 start_codon:yes stop_codon:yes gene_type:complete
MKIELFEVHELYKTLLIFLVASLVGCGATPLSYQAQPISIDEAYSIIDQMVMTQNKKWKPDYFVITDKYLGWDYGSVSSGGVNVVAYNNVGFGRSKATTRNVSDRVYFSKIKGVQMYDWKRKLQQWWTVALMGDNDRIIKYVLRTKNLAEAQQMVDALTVLLNDRSGAE